jgi:Domain of unknown function (DUF4258)
VELRFTEHALENMELRSISAADIETVIEHPDLTTIEEFEVVYDCVVRGRGIRVVLDRYSDPAWVVTVMPRRG